MSLAALLLVTAFSVGLAFGLGLLLKVQFSPLAYVGAGLFGHFLGGWLFATVGIEEPLVIALAGVSYAVLASVAGILLVLLLARFAPAVR